LNKINISMDKRFVKLYEATLSRFNRGGFLTSDRVKFVDGALSNEFFKNQPESVKAAVKSLIDSGLNLRVKNVKSFAPAVMGAGNTDDSGFSFNIEVVPETAPGRFDVNKTVVVPSNLLAHHNDYPNLPPVPDQFKYNNRVNIKPEDVEINDDKTLLTPQTQTHHSVVGNKLEKGDRELTDKNIKIPAVTATGQKDPASYTALYLPKN
jgi:hypothetical protein